MALNFLGKWFGSRRSDAPAIEEFRGELARLIGQRPAFAAPLKWLRELLPDLVPDVDAVPGPSLSTAQVRERLASGVPLLRGEPLAVDTNLFRQRWQKGCAALETVGPDSGAAALASALRDRRLDPLALVASVVGGRPEEVRQQAEAARLDADLTTLLRYVLFPHFAALAAKLAPLRAGSAWERGYCPTCGSWPLLGEFRGLDQSRLLRCGLCADAWEIARQLCVYCACHDHERLGFLQVEGEEMRWRVAVCDDCHCYVKMVNTLSGLSPLALLIADAATLHLDLAAAERGYTNTPR